MMNTKNKFKAILLASILSAVVYSYFSYLDDQDSLPAENQKISGMKSKPVESNEDQKSNWGFSIVVENNEKWVINLETGEKSKLSSRNKLNDFQQASQKERPNSSHLSIVKEG